MRLRRVYGLFFLLGVLLISGCSNGGENEARDVRDTEVTEQTETPPASTTMTNDVGQAPMTLEEILADEREGKFAGDRYDSRAIRKELDQMPLDLPPEKVYAYLLSLLGENYKKFVEAYDALENPDYSQQGPNLNPKAPQGLEGSALHVMILVDASGSMADKVPGGVKMDLAKEAVQDFAENLPEGSQVGLRVFGHKGSGAEKDKALSCSQTERVYDLGPYDEARFTDALKRFKPSGWTPIAETLSQAKKDLESAGGTDAKNVVYLVSDGIETCGGNPVEAAKALNRSDVQAVVNIIGFDVDDEAQRQLKQAAEAGGGEYVTVKDQKALKEAFQADLKRLREELLRWSDSAREKVRKRFAADSQRLSDINNAMFDTSMTEKGRLQDAVGYLRDVRDYEAWSDIDDWIVDRWQQLVDYKNERDRTLSPKLLDESSRSRHDLIEEKNKNLQKILDEERRLNQ